MDQVLDHIPQIVDRLGVTPPPNKSHNVITANLLCNIPLNGAGSTRLLTQGKAAGFARSWSRESILSSTKGVYRCPSHSGSDQSASTTGSVHVRWQQEVPLLLSVASYNGPKHCLFETMAAVEEISLDTAKASLLSELESVSSRRAENSTEDCNVFTPLPTRYDKTRGSLYSCDWLKLTLHKTDWYFSASPSPTDSSWCFSRWLRETKHLGAPGYWLRSPCCSEPPAQTKQPLLRHADVWLLNRPDLVKL